MFMGALCWHYLPGSRARAWQSYCQHLETTLSTKQSMSGSKGFRKLGRKKPYIYFLKLSLQFSQSWMWWAVFPLSRLLDVLKSLLPTKTMLLLFTLHRCIYHQMSASTPSRQFYGAELTLINIMGIFFPVYPCSYDPSGKPLGTSGHYSPSVTKW